MNREIISEKAFSLFSEKGYNHVSVLDICRACNISKPTFYHYVKSKEDLLATFYDDVTLHLTQKLSTLLDSENHWEQFIICFETLMEESVRVGADLGSQLFIMNLKEDHHSFDRRPYLTNIMLTIIRKGQEKGQILNPSSAESLYEAAAYVFTGYEVMWCIRNGNMEWRERMLRSLEAMFNVKMEYRI